MQEIVEIIHLDGDALDKSRNIVMEHMVNITLTTKPLKDLTRPNSSMESQKNSGTTNKQISQLDFPKMPLEIKNPSFEHSDESLNQKKIMFNSNFQQNTKVNPWSNFVRNIQRKSDETITTSGCLIDLDADEGLNLRKFSSECSYCKLPIQVGKLFCCVKSKCQVCMTCMVDFIIISKLASCPNCKNYLTLREIDKIKKYYSKTLRS